MSTGSPWTLRPVHEASAAELAEFTGALRVCASSGGSLDLPIRSGYRVDAHNGRATDAKVEVAFPMDRRLDSAVRRMPSSMVAHLVVPNVTPGGEFDCDLPQDATGLPNYTGGLWGREYAGMAHYRWRVEFVRGRAVRIREWTEGD